jgi:PII-like signaling protein
MMANCCMNGSSRKRASRVWPAPPYCAHSRLHTFKIERLSQDLPIVVEIVDAREKLETFLELIDHEIEEGMATLEEVKIHFYRSGKSA